MGENAAEDASTQRERKIESFRREKAWKARLQVIPLLPYPFVSGLLTSFHYKHDLYPFLRCSWLSFRKFWSVERGMLPQVKSKQMRKKSVRKC